MKRATTTSIQVGPGFLGCLCIIFVIAKLTGHIDWSWWLVFAPILAVPAIAVLIAAGCGVVLVIITLINVLTKPRRSFRG